LASIGADLLIRTLGDFETDDIHPVSQDHSQATHAPLLKKGDGHIDWSKPAEKLESFIRGVTPWPGAFTFHGDKQLKILKQSLCRSTPKKHRVPYLMGFQTKCGSQPARVYCRFWKFRQHPGAAYDKNFLQGYKIPPGTVLS
jgi:methionyl-tRNA formyltransferase